VSTSGDIYVFRFNGSYNAIYDAENDSISKTNITVSDIYETQALDIDDDGFVDDYVVADQGPNTGMIWAFDNNSNQVWNYTVPSTNDNALWSMSIGDINDDGLEDIVFSDDEYNTLHVLNKSGSLLWIYVSATGDIGSNYGSSPASDISDINNDGIYDIAVASSDGNAYILQSVACIATFTDSSYNMTWNNSIRKWQMSRTFGSSGLQQYNITCSKGGYEIQTIASQILVGNNTEPAIDQMSIGPTPAYRNSSMNCSAHIVDNESQNINVSFTWYINGTNDGSWNTTVECTNNTWCETDDHPTGILKHYNITCSARAFDGVLYSDWKDSPIINISNHPPSQVTLLKPEDDQTIFNRTPFFNWTESIDIDNDTVWYQLVVDDTPTFDFPEINITLNSTTNYTPTLDLDITTYYWYVRPYDNESWGDNSTVFNFTIISSVVISMPIDSIAFGSLTLNQTNTTYDENPYPFTIQNDGNVFLDIYLNSTQIWYSQPLGTSYYQTKVNQTAETGSFNWSGSQTTWINIVNNSKIIEDLNYSNTNDSAKIDIQIRVPPDEPEGDREATVTISAIET